MVRKYAIPELDATFTDLKVFASARQLIIVESKDIVKECRESITAAHSANAAIPGNQEDALKEAQEKAEKAGEILKKLQKRMKSDYGRFWSQDLNEFFINAEQEVVEAFSTLAVIKQEEIPPRDIPFRIQDPDSYPKVKTTVKVSDLAYIFGLLDCVGELKRVIVDSLNRDDSDFAKNVFIDMQELFKKLEPLTQFSNSFHYLKPKIDAARYAVNDAKKLVR